MSKPTDIKVLEVRVEFEPLPFRAPLKFGGRVVTHTDIINVYARVENGRGEQAEGFGSMPLGNVWAWPSQKVDAQQSAEAIRRLASTVGQQQTTSQIPRIRSTTSISCRNSTGNWPMQ